jgi:uncharacterized protein (TIGR02391 family)
MPIPNIETLVAMEPEELGAHLLMAIKAEIEPPRRQMVHSNNDMNQLARRLLGLDHSDLLPTNREAERERAMVEAWHWLEAQGLLVPASRTNGQNGWRVPSRRAMQFSSVAEFVPYAVARRLDPGMLNLRIRAKVWGAFVRGDFDVAALVAMKAVEIAVREASGYGYDKFGKAMMGMAFNPENGPLTDMAAEKPEREARRDLFCGAIGLLKNPLSHRDVDMEDAAEAVEVALLANHLLRIVERQKHRAADGDINRERPGR